MFSLFLIWLGGFLTGFSIALNLPTEAPAKVKTSDLYPPKGGPDA